jgi:cell wall-associated NlpC family hydrolase
MSSQPITDRGISRGTSVLRRAVLAAALATAGVSTIAVPFAGPASVAAAPSTVQGSSGSARKPDAIADQARQALAMVRRFEETGDPMLMSSFRKSLASMATTVATRVEVDPATMRNAWSEADIDHQLALVAALSQLGVPYRRNTSKPNVSFDCSGLTSFAWLQAGVDIPRQSTSQIRTADPRDPETAQAGDLVQYPGHVMMWLGVERAVVHAVMPGRPVEVDVITNRHKLAFGDPAV